MYNIGIDLGGTNIKAGLVKDGVIVKKSSIKTHVGRPYEEIIADMAAQVKRLCASAGVDLEDVASVGVGCPGAITGETGLVCYSNNFGWTNVPLGQMLSGMLGKPVRVSNDANVAALGEALYGGGKNLGDIVMITLGTGVGGGIVLGGKLFEGNESKGAEIGHTVIALGGEQCTCGRRGCLEAYTSATALIKQTRLAMQEDKDSLMWKLAGDLDGVNGKTAFEAEKLGDAAAAKVVKKYLYYLSEGIMNFCNIFRPNAIVIGGGVSAQGKNLTDRLTAICEEGHYGYRGTPKVKIIAAKLENDAGILGAASL